MANAGQNRSSTLLYALLGVVVIASIVFGVRHLTREVVQVRVAPATFQSLSSTVSTVGKVEPVVDFSARAPFAGSIQEIYVNVGDHVRKGSLLIRMDDADARSRLATARASLSSAQSSERDIRSGGSREEQNRYESDIAAASIEQRQATAELATRKTLLQSGAASPAEVAAAQQRLDAANQALQSSKQRSTQRYNPQDLGNAQAHVADAQAAVDAAINNLDNVDIRSPFEGEVYNIRFSRFDFVPAAEDLVDVADLNHLQIRAYFDEPEIGKLAHGQAVKIIWDAKLGKVWHGHVELAPTAVEIYGTRNVGVCVIGVDDASPDLIPNTNVTVTVTEAEHTRVLSIPREAWHNEAGQSYVYRTLNNRLVKTPVKTGIVTLTAVEIVSGLSEGDLIVKGAKTSTAELSNGLEVKQVE